MVIKRYSINLIPQQNKSLLDKVMFFLLHYFRYIIVLTQIVVISVFFARFSLDQEIVDLKESYMDKQAILQIMKPLIQEVDAYVKKQKSIETIIYKQNDFVNDFDFILSSIPDDVSLTTLQRDDGKIFIKGSSGSIISVKRLLIRLSQEKRFKKVKIKELTGSIDTQYIFSIDILLKIL